jgi:electron transport complex protein RnfD
MNFTIKQPPIKYNQQRSYKRNLNLHVALIVISIVSIFTRAFIAVPEGETWVPDQMFKTFLMLLVAAGFSVIIEILYAIGEGKANKFATYNNLVDPINSGLLIALLLPTSTPIYALLLAVFIGVYVAKLVFGGYGYYIFNPALVGVLFVNISFASVITYGDTPLLQLKAALEGATLNFNLLDLLVGNYAAVAIGSTSIIVLTGLFIYLLITRVVDYRISGTFIGTIVVMSLIIGYISFGAGTISYTLVNLMTGLTMFGAVFLVSESVTSPTSREAKLIYAVVVAIMTMLVRVIGAEPEGVVFAVLLGNMITPFLNRTVTRSNKSTLLKTSITLAVVVLFAAAVIGFILQGRLIEIFGTATTMMGGLF